MAIDPRLCAEWHAREEKLCPLQHTHKRQIEEKSCVQVRPAGSVCVRVRWPACPSSNAAVCFDSAAALINADFLRRRRRQRNGEMTFVLHRTREEAGASRERACMMERVRSKKRGRRNDGGAAKVQSILI